MKILPLLLSLACCLSSFANSPIMSVNEALAEAQESQKNILLNYKAEWCLPCQMVKINLLSNQEINKIINDHFVNVVVDTDALESVDWQTNYNMSCLPYFMVVDPDGDILEELAGAPTSEEFINFLTTYVTSEPEALPDSQAVDLSGIASETNVSKAKVLPKKKKTVKKLMNNTIIETITPVIELKTIRVGAFAIYDNALNFAEELKNKFGFEVSIEKHSNKNLHLLNLEEFYQEIEILPILQTLKENNIDHYIKVKNSK